MAFATYRASPGLSDDDRLVADALRPRGVTVSPAVWDDPHVDWSRYSLVVIRSTWDYPLRPAAYEAWLRGFSSAGRRLWNPPAAVLDNINKRYLVTLAGRGVAVVPTAYQPASEGVDLREVLDRGPWDEVVIKPAVSAGARGTWRTSRAAAGPDRLRFAEQARAEDLLIQPYLPEVATRGEWSLVFLGGDYSHAALKTPAKGDFRVQEHFGGISTAAVAPPEFVEQARSVLRAVDHPLLYARVDGVERDGRFLLMELEINESYLFVGLSDGAAARFADAIVHVLLS